MGRGPAIGQPPRRWAAFIVLLGVYLSLRGYHSRDGDQAYRLPLLLHRQDPSLYAADPFVRAFDAFNPHRGYLALLDWTSRPLGLSAALALLFALTFAATALGVDRLARSAWPEKGPGIGLLAVCLVLLAKAGNIGTNHLFEGMLLDRLIGFGLGWIALASIVAGKRGRSWPAPLAIGLAALIHPSVGLQLAMLAGGGLVAWCLLPRKTGVDWKAAARGVLGLALALLPAMLLHGGGGAAMFRGLSREEFLLLGATIQGPQHMLPHLWRRPQWLAWAGLMALAALTLLDGRERTGAGESDEARGRLGLLLGVNLLGLGLAWVAIEAVHDLRTTLFQPFRMATIARGLALVIVAGRIQRLWNRGDAEGQARAMLLVVGLTGDWSLVAASGIELLVSAVEWTRPAVAKWSGIMALGIALAVLARHDPESGHGTILVGLAGLWAYRAVVGVRRCEWTPRRVALAFAAAWAVPLAALLAPTVLEDRGAGRAAIEALAGRCRFGEVAVDDVERLALWCRENTPKSARFIGPPGPKAFRLWSRREVAFNRAASPYHAAGLADWSARFRDHVGFAGSTTEFARAYLVDRHGLEARFGRLTAEQKAALARRQGAGFLLDAAPKGGAAIDEAAPLELLRVEGRYAIYRVRPPVPIQARTASAASAGTG